MLNRVHLLVGALLTVASLTSQAPAYATEVGGRLIATGGAMTIEGAAGGGIVPWSVLAGYPEQGQYGGSVALTGVNLPDFELRSAAAAATFDNRLEISLGQQRFDIESVAAGETLEQTIVGFKLRLAGDLVYTDLPQLSIGTQFKHNDSFAIPEAVGARSSSGVDVYVAASKLWLHGLLGRTTFLNGTVRATRANQLGLLGFGGDRNDDYRWVGEVSAGLFLNRHWVVGLEYRQKPDNLAFAREDDWYDAFIGWFPSKRWSVVGAWSRLGSIAGFEEQDSLYLSVQLSH